jgi:hypothetical protein
VQFFYQFQDAYEPNKPKSVEHAPPKETRFNHVLWWLSQKRWLRKECRGFMEISIIFLPMNFQETLLFAQNNKRIIETEKAKDNGWNRKVLRG